MLSFPVEMMGPMGVSRMEDAGEGTGDWKIVGSVERNVGDSGLNWTSMALGSGGVSRTKPSGMSDAFLVLRVK